MFNHPPIFTYFPHSPGVPDVLPPAVTVTDGDWKLMRLFYQGENGTHDYRLYNLKNDIGETNDLAVAQPARVKQMDALIDKFLSRTAAVTPRPNPAYDPTAKKTGPPQGKRKPAKQSASLGERQKLEAESDAGL